MPFNIVLLEPEIPNNTGNIGRLSLAANAKLHLIKPFGFTIDDRKLKRAGLDYWQHISIVIYDSASAFFDQHQDKKMVYFSSHGKKEYWSLDFEEELFLVFGKESTGLPKELLQNNSDHSYKIPLYNEHIRSLNIANAVSVVLYEGLRQLNT